MIILTYRHLLQTQFIPTLRKLHDMSVFDASTAYRIHKIFEKIGKPYQECFQAFLALGEQYAEKDDKGNPKLHEPGTPRGGQHVVEPAKIHEYEHALKKMLDTQFTVQQLKLQVGQLTSRFSGQEIAALEPIVDGLEAY